MNSDNVTHASLTIPAVSDEDAVREIVDTGEPSESEGASELRQLPTEASVRSEQPQDSSSADYKPPWNEREIPEGWAVSDSGLYRLLPQTEGQNVPGVMRVGGATWIRGLTHNTTGEQWGALIHFKDIDKHEHKLCIPRSRFHEQGCALAQELAGLGLEIVPGKEKALLQYLAACQPVQRLRCVDKLGWLEGDDIAYVLPDTTIGSKSVIFQPERHAPISMTTSGTLAQWQNNVVKKCKGKPALVFSLCAGLTAPLLKIMSMDSFGINFYGKTSSGKTTAAQLAGSIWGNAADPASAPDSAFIRRWNTTANALEAVAASHNDGLLVLDELGSCTARDFQAVVYNLFGGQGKSAMDASRNLKPQRAWRIVAVSTGEISAKQKLEEEGRIAKAGQLVRLFDIPFNEPSLTRESVDDLKASCSQHYGAAGRCLLNRLRKKYKNIRALRAVLKPAADQALQQLKGEQILTPERERVAKRFALIMVAGFLAQKLKVLNISQEEITNSVSDAWQLWLESNDSLSDASRGVAAVRDFISRHHEARFKPYPISHDSGGNRRDLAGFVDRSNGTYYLTDVGMKEACHGFNVKDVCTELRTRGFLVVDRVDRSMNRISVDGARIPVYGIKKALLEME